MTTQDGLAEVHRDITHLTSRISTVETMLCDMQPLVKESYDLIKEHVARSSEREKLLSPFRNHMITAVAATAWSFVVAVFYHVFSSPSKGTP